MFYILKISQFELVQEDVQVHLYVKGQFVHTFINVLSTKDLLFEANLIKSILWERIEEIRQGKNIGWKS